MSKQPEASSSNIDVLAEDLAAGLRKQGWVTTPNDDKAGQHHLLVHRHGRDCIVSVREVTAGN